MEEKTMLDELFEASINGDTEKVNKIKEQAEQEEKKKEGK